MNWQTVRKWRTQYVLNQGRLQLDQRGRCPSTKSFLDDPGLKEQALEWLREQLRLMRKKKVDSPPLSLTRFHRWINSTLLTQVLAPLPPLQLSPPY